MLNVVPVQPSSEQPVDWMGAQWIEAKMDTCHGPCKQDLSDHFATVD